MVQGAFGSVVSFEASHENFGFEKYRGFRNFDLSGNAKKCSFVNRDFSDITLKSAVLATLRSQRLPLIIARP